MILGRDRSATVPRRSTPSPAGLRPFAQQSELMSDMMIKAYGCTENNWPLLRYHDNAGGDLAMADMIERIHNVE
jgi:hypothetical protein